MANCRVSPVILVQSIDYSGSIGKDLRESNAGTHRRSTAPHRASRVKMSKSAVLRRGVPALPCTTGNATLRVRLLATTTAPPATVHDVDSQAA